MVTPKRLRYFGTTVLALWAASFAIAQFAPDRGDNLPLMIDDIVWSLTLLGTVALIILCGAVFARRRSTRGR